MSDETTLTAKEEAEFTAFNAAAYDLVRMNAHHAGTIPPMWLCMSEEAKAEARRSFSRFLWEKSNIVVNNDDELRRAVPGLSESLNRGVAQWKAAELEMKKERAAGNPRAFFAG